MEIALKREPAFQATARWTSNMYDPFPDLASVEQALRPSPGPGYESDGYIYELNLWGLVATRPPAAEPPAAEPLQHVLSQQEQLQRLQLEKQELLAERSLRVKVRGSCAVLLHLRGLSVGQAAEVILEDGPEVSRILLVERSAPKTLFDFDEVPHLQPMQPSAYSAYSNEGASASGTGSLVDAGSDGHRFHVKAQEANATIWCALFGSSDGLVTVRVRLLPKPPTLRLGSTFSFPSLVILCCALVWLGCCLCTPATICQRLRLLPRTPPDTERKSAADAGHTSARTSRTGSPRADALAEVLQSVAELVARFCRWSYAVLVGAVFTRGRTPRTPRSLPRVPGLLAGGEESGDDMDPIEMDQFLSRGGHTRDEGL